MLHVVYACGLLSIGASAWLVMELHSLDARVRRRLFARQLSLLASIDLALTSSLLLWCLVDQGVVVLPGEWQARMCWATAVPYFSCRWMSLLMGTHIAAGLAAAWFRWIRVIRFMGWSLPMVLVTGAGLGFGQLWEVPLAAGKTGTCHWSSNSVGEVATMGLLACFAVAIVCHAVAVARACASPGRLRWELVRVLSLYALCFWASYGPVLIFHDNQTLAYDLALGAEACNGLWNTGTYFVQKRTSWKRARRRLTRHSVVAGGGVVSPGDVVSFHVLFDAHEGAVFEVDRIAGEAGRRSEQEILNRAQFSGRLSEHMQWAEAGSTGQSIASHVGMDEVAPRRSRIGSGSVVTALGATVIVAGSLKGSHVFPSAWDAV
mmetsp:Transcript_43122/g.97158  ORF Transcript_43122/g.97158 Transcript_43122/m.97158 type:complete len:376 (+) Transcript_43122:44-1171(+)